MAKTKKVILFIVEGITDAISLENILIKLNKDQKVFFQIVKADITSDYATNTSNIINRIADQVKICIRNEHFKKNDIIKIVHLVDIDGVYVDAANIKFNPNVRIKYLEDRIETNSVDANVERNIRKSSVLNKISAKNEILSIPYVVYYFSTNLEHVLHGIQNALEEEKNKLAEMFEDKYYDNPEEFLNFINNEEFAVKCDYFASWEFIKKDNNSLKRYTNLNLLFKQK